MAEHLEICVLIACNVSEKNPPMNNGQTPLHIAAENGNLEVCQFFTICLLTMGKDTNPSDNYGKTPIDVAWDGGIKKFLKSKWLKSEL